MVVMMMVVVVVVMVMMKAMEMVVIMVIRDGDGGNLLTYLNSRNMLSMWLGLTRDKRWNPRPYGSVLRAGRHSVCHPCLTSCV